MTYLFGDSSPSDLQLDYIDLLRDALDFSAQILAADERMLDGTTRAADSRRIADAEVARLETLGATLARAVEGVDVGAPESATAQCAHSLLRSSADLVRAAIERVHAGVAADAARIEDEARRDRERCVEALAAFLKRHDLPSTTSELRLQQQAGNGYAARLYLRGLGDLQAVIELEIPPTHLLAHVARVDKLVERLEIHAPEAGGWLRKEVKLRPQRLDKEFITAFVAGGRESTIHLRTAADGTGEGFDIVLRNDAPRVSLRRIGEGGDLPPFDLDDTDAGKIHELKAQLASAAQDLVGARKALVEAALGDTPLNEHRDPKQLVERLVALMAPVVKEIAKRSLTPTELVLKRQTGDGRREEIFVSRRDLQVKLRGLSERSRALFKPLELGELPPGDDAGPKRDAIAVEKALPRASVTASRPSLFGDLKADGGEAPHGKAEARGGEVTSRGEPSAAETRTVPPPPRPRKDDAVRLDDSSVDRLIVSDDKSS
jgi:hypothetical protein